MKISAVLLAAGTSTRMGVPNKLLLPFRGKTVLHTVAASIIASGVDELIVVTGHEAERAKTAFKGLPVCFVPNPGYASGMTSSIQAGVRAAQGEGYLICPGDLPLLTEADYRRIVLFFKDLFRSDPKAICVPEFQGTRGHPVLFSAYYRNEIMQHSAPEGCKRILKAHPNHVYEISFSQPSILMDIDTPEAYQNLLQGETGL